MTSPLLKTLSREEATQELEALKRSVQGSFPEFEERAHNYDLTPHEFAIWERISELQWLLNHD